jgi:hypothetical protein
MALEDDLEVQSTVRGGKLYALRASVKCETQMWFAFLFLNFILAGVANYNDLTKYYYSCGINLF